MAARTDNWKDPGPLDKQAESSANRIADKHGLRDRARSTWKAMANELLEDLQPAIESQARIAADEAAKTRLRDILALPETKGRRDQAERLALDTNAPIDRIKGILAASPKAPRGPSELSLAMQQATPGISSDGPDPAGPLAEEDEAVQAILNA